MTRPEQCCSTVIPSLRMHSRVAWQSALEANPVTREGPLAIDASIATRCEIDLSPGTFNEPLIRAGPLTFIDLDIATCRMLHNDAPCDHLACHLERFDQLLVKVERKGIPRADDRDHRAFNRQQTRVCRSGRFSNQECDGKDRLRGR